MYQHLQSPITVPLLPFLPWAMVPRIVIIWRSNQSSSCLSGCWNRRCQEGGSVGRPRFGLLILQPPFANSSKYFVMLQGVRRSEKQAVIQPAWRLCKHERLVHYEAEFHFCECAGQTSASWRTPWACILDFKCKTSYVKLFRQAGLTFRNLGLWELWR